MLKLSLLPFRNKIKSAQIKLLEKLNLDCRRITSSFPKHISVDNIDSILEIEPYLFKKNVLLKNIPLYQLRGLPFLKWGKESNHPFAVAVKRAHEASADQRLDLIHQTLHVFYTSVTPNYMAELVTHNAQMTLPAWAIIMPWESDSIDQWTHMIKQSVMLENRRCGSNANINQGWSWLGPVSKAKLNIEAKRLLHTMQSILSKGYQRSDMPDGDINGDLLINNNGDWIIQTIGGQHRAATLSGLEFEHTDIRIKSIIKAAQVEHWPQVKAGLYTTQQALDIFNHVFTGTPPQAYQAWENKRTSIHLN